MFEVYGEKLDGMRNPAGMTNVRPAFSWRLRASEAGVVQVAYRLIVATATGVPVWDSGRVASPAVHGLVYEGDALSPNADYIWRVTSFASTGEEAAGAAQSFSTGITDRSLWQAGWIESTAPRKPPTDSTDSMQVMRGSVPTPENREDALNPCVYFRRAVGLRGEIRRATAYATAHGIYKLYVNGTSYGQPFVPGYTAYAKHLEVQRYDVTGSLTGGENVFAAIVADGWYTGKIGLMGVGDQYGTANAFFLQVFIEYADGTTEVVSSDERFRWNTGGYRYADLFIGEKFDARFEPGGVAPSAPGSFARPGFDDSAWQAVAVEDYGYDQLTGPMSDPVRVLREQPPRALLLTPSGDMVLDAGENVVGWVRARLRGVTAQVVTLEYSEALDERGEFFQNLRQPGQNKDQKDCYVFRGDGEAEYEPRFTFHGFQYVRIAGVPDAKPSDFTVVVVGSDLEPTGTFHCSDERLDRLQRNIFRSQQGNMLSIPTDCPQREKAGWTGDMQVYAPTACFNMDVQAFLRQWLYDMRLEQLANGQIPHVVPDIPSNAYIGESAGASSAGWGDACVIVPYRLYQAYGDATVLRENYDMMLRWMAYAEHEAATGVPAGHEEMAPERRERQKYLWNTGFHFGDWLVPSLLGKGGPMLGAELTRAPAATAMFAHSTSLMSEIATILGDTRRASHFRELNERIREAFAAEYVDEHGRLSVDLQGIYVLALRMGLVPEAVKQATVDHLVRLIDDNGGCLDTGFLSVPFLLDVLYDHGRPDMAFKLLFQTKRPSWLYEIGWGATTMWESWNNITEDGSRRYQSYNHFAFGCVGDFIYRRVLGLQSAVPGYARVRIDPDLSCGLSWASGSLETVLGRVVVDWKIDGSEAVVRAEVPPNMTAELCGAPHGATIVGSGRHEFRRRVGP